MLAYPNVLGMLPTLTALARSYRPHSAASADELVELTLLTAIHEVEDRPENLALSVCWAASWVECTAPTADDIKSIFLSLQVMNVFELGRQEDD
jgi:hypothetical protein